MRPTPGLVARTLHSSLVDGPGNRFVVFLQGCNFDCFNCHNAHTINLCNGCGVCLDVCAPAALTPAPGTLGFDPRACDGCDRCLDVCPFDANPMVLERSVEDVLAELEPLEPFLSGITVSGGEPTLQLDFVRSLFAAVKRHPRLRRLTTFVDSNGSLDRDGWDDLAPWLDGAMIDVKAVTPAVHRTITGAHNGAVLASARQLRAMNKLHELRLLVIPGLTDSADELRAYAAFVRDLDPAVRVKLMAFRHHGVRPHGRRWPETDADTLAASAARLRMAGLANVVTAPA